VVLDRELATFREKLPELKADHEGKFALVHGDEFIDVFTSYEDAIKAGYARFDLEPFLVKQIHGLEQVQLITRLVAPSVNASEL
jgi:hypothetical protein